MLEQPRMKLEECTVHELTAYIDNCVREKSKKTGKPVKVNVYKWSKACLIQFIKELELNYECLKYINGWYHDLPGFPQDYRVFCFDLQ